MTPGAGIRRTGRRRSAEYDPNPDPEDLPVEEDVDAVASLTYDLAAIAKRAPVTLEMAANCVNNVLPGRARTIDEMLRTDETRHRLFTEHARLAVEWAMGIQQYSQTAARTMLADDETDRSDTVTTDFRQ